LEHLEASLAATDETQSDFDDDLDVKLDPVQPEQLKLEERAFEESRVRLEHLKKTTGDNHDEIIRFRIRDLLARDEYIASAAEYYDIAPNDRIKDITVDDVHRVQFTIKLTDFHAWREYHASVIGTAFIYQRDYVSTKNGLHKYTYYCQCHGTKQKRPGRTPGCISGKTCNLQKESIKRSCPAKFTAAETLKGIKERALVIDLYYHHVHELASLENIGMRQKSDRIKATIKSLLLQGSSIKNVMDRLTLNYDRFMDIVRGNGQRLSRDDLITYEDVYNIWYNINNDLMKKDPDAILSAMKWLEEIESKGGFSFYNKSDITQASILDFLRNGNSGNCAIMASLWALMEHIMFLGKTARCYSVIVIVRLDLRAILYENVEALASDRISQFRIKWRQQVTFMEYLTNNYFGPEPIAVENPAAQEIAEAEQSIQLEITRQQQRWMFYYREGMSYASINTNNYIESWHNTLKQHFFRDKQKRRVSTVISVLNVMTAPHYQQKCMRGLVNVGKINPAQREEKKHLDKIKAFVEAMGETGPTMYQLTSIVVAVGSFTTPGVFYEITIDFTKVSAGYIISCSCPSFEQEESCCKLITLLQLEVPHLRFLRVDREDIHRDLDQLALAPEVDHGQQDLQQDLQQEPLPELGLSYYVNRIVSLEALRDKNQTMPHKSQLCELLDRFLNIYEPSLPRKESEDLSNKRQRQRY
ncbi:hypothetical protein EC991_009822, partial [Linnemannia zychae]